jgi:TonB family protein
MRDEEQASSGGHFVAPHLPEFGQVREDAAVLHFDENGPRPPRLPRSRWSGLLQAGASLSFHVVVLATVLRLAQAAVAIPPPAMVAERAAAHTDETVRMIFVARDLPPAGGGGGGGGNQRPEPIRRAQGIGSDPITVRVARPITIVDTPTGTAPLEGVLLDAKPLASGSLDQIGLPDSGELTGLSTGPGSGGGVGTGTGTGIGPGIGPGVGPGSGGGIGGGVYRPGGSVTSPRLKQQVRPSYTEEALRLRVQGTVVLESVIDRNGRPTRIRVVTSLDPGLDREAILAAGQWQFEPGRLAGTPVEVLVTIALDFRIH